MSTPIFLASGNRMKRVMWKGPGGSWGDLAALHKKGTRINPRFARGSRELARSPFTDVRFPGRLARGRKPPDPNVAALETGDRTRGRPASRRRPGRRVFAARTARLPERVADPSLPPTAAHVNAASSRTRVNAFSLFFLVKTKTAFYLDENREVPAELELTQRSFMLRDPEYGVAYEGFALHLVKEGSVVEIRDCVLEAEAEAAAAEARAIQASLAVGPDEYFVVDARPVAPWKGERAPSEFSESDASDVSGDDASADEEGPGKARREGAARERGEGKKGSRALSKFENTDLENTEVITEEEQKAALEWAKRVLDYRRRAFTLKQRTWQFLDEPGSSPGAAAFTFFMLAVIVFSTFTFCVETLPQYYQHETNFANKFFIMEAVCISLFTAELIARLLTTPDLKNYFYDRMNAVDVVAVAPFYFELALANAAVPGLSVLRVVRLVRVFRLFKVSRGSLTIFTETMARSAKPLYMLVFFTGIATIILSSLVYYAERGEWNDALGMWMRAHVWYCPVRVGPNQGPVVKDPLTYTLDSGITEPCVWIDPATYAIDYPNVDYPSEAMFRCPFAYEKDKETCVLTYEQSPFDSIPTSFWWCLVTMTTVGYGDVVPTQAFGQFVGGLVMIFGIVVIALPITVIGSNFATIYKSHVTSETLSAEEREQQEEADDELSDFEDEEVVLRNDDAL